jgi:hypothetical protein
MDKMGTKNGRHPSIIDGTEEKKGRRVLSESIQITFFFSLSLLFTAIINQQDRNTFTLLYFC